MRTRGTYEDIEVEDDTVPFVGVIVEQTVKEMLADIPAIVGGGEGTFTTRNDGVDLAHCYGPDRFDNAALFASSPLLLAALDTIMRDGLNKTTRAKARAAIKSARRK